MALGYDRRVSLGYTPQPPREELGKPWESTQVRGGTELCVVSGLCASGPVVRRDLEI